MAANLERQAEEKLRLRPHPDIFSSKFLRFSKRKDKEMDSMVTTNQCMVMQQQRGGAVEKQKAPNAKGEVKSRITLNSIENVYSPISRFGAKTFAITTETQAVAASNNLPVMFPSDKQAAQPMLALKPATKKPVKLVPEQNENINLDISSDDGTKQMSISVPRTKMRRDHSLTSVLSARSKVACSISEKSNPEIDEIDLPDVFNHLAVVEYVQDLYTFYKQQQHVGRPIDYMEKQPHINPKMRAILVDWITDVHLRYNLLPETLYLTIYIIDRYLSLDGVKRLQLVGMCALLIACKYEELRAPRVSDLIYIAFNKYTREEILGMEKTILNKLEWYLTVPTTYMFLVRFVKVAKADQELEHMIYFLAELGLMQYDLIKYCPSMVAASAVYTACCTLGKSPLWTNALERHTSFSEPQLLECARVLVKAHWTAPGSKLKVIYQKYLLQQFGGVARYPPAMSLIELSNSGEPSSS
ncbi:G2/mitotic-specific cyclin S13-7-like isoform X2 [Carex littledalei]|uniref:G2/mitotic-specific cyclin S13-7-like isoform X2 n=1 Tax=Carex littledalei TaxID=544730 RepID=A0A833QQG1_9POAL|nr:G2/mitotic-specific cyclin S13-7-like isoform X2 [Carex littledalei]